MVMEDLQHILPDQVRNINFCTGRKIQIALIAAVAILAVTTITFAGLYGAKHVEKANANEIGGSFASLKQQQAMCMSRECLKAAAWMVKNMNPSASPCEDFYEFACGAWNDRMTVPPESSYTSVRYKIWQNNEEKLRDLIESKIKRNTTNSSERKLKEFFLSCLHDYGRYQEGGMVLVDIIKNHLGGWYVFDPDNFTDQWDMTRAMTSAHSEYLVNILFDLSVNMDLRDYEKNIITLQEAYKDFMLHAAYLMAWDANVTVRRDVINQFVEDAYYQEARIAQGMKDIRRTPGWWKSSVATISQLNSNFSQINWLPIMRGMFGQDITEQTEVAMRQKPYFEFINQLLANETQNKTRIMNNYIVWRMIYSYAYHLSWDYKYAGFTFYEKYTGQDLYLPTWEHCLGTVEYRLGSALAAQFLHEYVGVSGKKAADKMIQRLKDTLNATIDDVSWMDNVTKAKAKEKIHYADSLTGFPGEYFNATFVDQLHSSLQINQSLGYFRNLLNINNFTKTLRRMELDVGKHFQLWKYIMSGGGFGVSPRFYWSFHTLIVPAGSMQLPQYHVGDTAFISYASLGSLIAEELAKTVNERGRYVWYNGTYMYWWSRQTYSNYTRARNCVQNDLTSREAGPFLVEGENITVPLGSNGAWHVMSDIMGIRTAYKAYQDIVPGKHILPALNLTNQQAFFLSAAQMRCVKRRDEDAYSRARAGYIPDNLLINAALSHMDEFSTAFKCPKDSSMNLPNKCDVF